MARRSTSPGRKSGEVDRERFRTEFGAALDAQLRTRGVTRTKLAAATGVSNAYVTKLTKSAPSPEWVEIVAEAIGASDYEKLELHLAAARDRGYKI